MELIWALSILRVRNIERNAAWWETDKRQNLYEYNLWHKLKKDESFKILGNTSVNNVRGLHDGQSLPYVLTICFYNLKLPGCGPDWATELSLQRMPLSFLLSKEDFPCLLLLSFSLVTPHHPLSSNPTSLLGTRTQNWWYWSRNREEKKFACMECPWY